MPLIIALVFAAVIVAIVAWIGSSGWMIRSAMEDLARRRRLLSGSDPLQLTALQAADSARRSHQLALDGLTNTINEWYDLQRTLAIGTPLEFGYSELRAKAEAAPAFTGLLEKANAAVVDNAAEVPTGVVDLIAESARMDAMTLEIRSYLHRERPSKPPGPRRSPTPPKAPKLSKPESPKPRGWGGLFR